MAIELRPGQSALYASVIVGVLEFVHHDKAQISTPTGIRTVLRRDLLPIVDGGVLEKTSIADVSTEVWDVASKRAKALRSICSLATGRAEAVDAHAKELGISTRHLWRLVQDYKHHETVSGLMAQSAGRKVGTRVLDIRVERIIAQRIESDYLVKERPTIKSLHETIGTQCREEDLPPPSLKTVTRRVANYEDRTSQVKRLGSKKAKYIYKAMPGHVEVSRPLERVEIDHTPMDVMACSDDPLCGYLGRPWLTIAVDVCTRCVMGIHIGFEPPSILSVALCLTHAVLPKNPAAEFGVPLDWIMQGLPKEIVVDNGKDFVSEAFRRGCEEHGIVLSYRPVGSPHYGGTIERLIGTMMGRCHLLPGTTKNSVRAKGDYDSAKHAVMTLSQLRRWFVEQVLGHYHVREHRMLRMPPIEAWKRLAEDGDAAA